MLRAVYVQTKWMDALEWETPRHVLPLRAGACPLDLRCATLYK